MFYDEQNHARHAWWHRYLIRDLCRYRHDQLMDVTKDGIYRVASMAVL
jgi:hypothetical protein